MGALVHFPEPSKVQLRHARSTFAKGEQSIELHDDADLTNVTPLGLTRADAAQVRLANMPERTAELALIFALMQALPPEVRSKAAMTAYKTAEQHPSCIASQEAATAVAALTLALDHRARP